MNNRLSKQSVQMLKNLDTDAYYIKFLNICDYTQKTQEQAKADYGSQNLFVAVVCDSLGDKDVQVLLAGDNQLWLFDDQTKAQRSIARLNDSILVYVESSFHFAETADKNVSIDLTKGEFRHLLHVYLKSDNVDSFALNKFTDKGFFCTSCDFFYFDDEVLENKEIGLAFCPVCLNTF